MKKIKQLSFVLFIFSVLALSYPVKQVFAQGGAGMNGGECDPNPACVENCCNECDPNPACVENCCPAESPENPNNDPGSSGSSDTATFCPNCGPDSLGQRGNIPHKPTGKILRHPSATTTNKPTSGITRNPRDSNGSRSTPNIQGIEDRANRRPQSRTSTPLFVPPRGTQSNAQDRHFNHQFKCEDIRSEISDKLYIVERDLDGLPDILVNTGCDFKDGKSQGCLLLNLESGDTGRVIYGSIEKIREILGYIRSRCLAN